MKQEVIVSVIMPAYNAEQYIEESIASVLSQNFRNIELIIVNDCSTDNTLEIIKNVSLKDSRVIVIDNLTNLGCANSRNKALLKAKGEYIAFCDSDDIWECEKIEKQLKHIKNNNVDMVFTAYEMIDDESKHIKYRNIKPEITFDDMLKENIVIFSTTLFKRSSIENIKFNSEWYHEDYIFLLDCLEHQCELIGLNEVLVKYRIHSNGRSFNKLCAAKNRWIILRKHLKFNFILSSWYFMQYAFHGIIKYY